MLWKSLLHKLRWLRGAERRSRDLAPPPEDVDRCPGSWHHQDLAWMAASVEGVEGDFAEIGVFRGAAFRKVVQLAHEQRRTAHAFDSFSGMDEPGAHDGTQYGKGKFDVGGPAQFLKLMDKARRATQPLPRVARLHFVVF